MKNGLHVLMAGFLLVLSGPFVSGHGINLPKSPPIYGYGLTHAFPGVKFTQPVAIATPPGETNSLYVVERLGRIIVISDLTRPEPKVFLDLRESTDASYGEAGLLGMAFHPQYRTNGRFFVFSTRAVAGSYCDTIAEYKRDEQDFAKAAVSTEKIIIAQPDSNDSHNGGDLHFGPDGYLYISVGYDGPLARQKPQAIDEGLFSGILRIDVDGRPGNPAPNAHAGSNANYRIPADNPFVGATEFNGAAVDPAAVETELYAVGLRNPWRFTFDPLTGQLLCADVGEAWWEEVNVIEKGRNYGWPFFEGGSFAHRTNPPPNLTSPVYEYMHGSGAFEGRVIIGGIVYTGSNLPNISGKYLFGDLERGHVWAMNVNETNAPLWLTGMIGLSTFGRDPRDDEVLVANLHNGEIHKLIYRAPKDSGVPERLSQVNAFANLSTLDARGSTPYEVITPFWSDGAAKRRWVNFESADGSIQFKANEPWGMPTGTIFIKHFDLEMTKGVPTSRRRLETRFLVHSTNGFYGLTYRWNTLGTDAELVPPSGSVELLKVNEGGVTRDQKWYYPGWQQCAICHNESAGRVLGFNTHQLNRTVVRAEGSTNQLDWMRQHDFFSNPDEVRSEALPRFSSLTDTNAPFQHRVRSYLASNCAQCHRPGGSSAMNWDGRITTPIENAKIINAPSVWFPDPAVKIIAPRNHVYSFMYDRVYHEDEHMRMPPLTSVRADSDFVDVLTNWIYVIPQETWTSGNIGPAILEGSAEQSGRTFSISSSGPGIEQDGVFFLSREVRGETEINGQFSDLKVGAGQGGIMLRANELPESPYAAIYVSGTDLIFRVRREAGGPSEMIARASSRLRGWVGLSRSGNEVTARLQGLNGDWQALGSTSVDLGTTIRAGFFSASRQLPAKFVTAKIRDYSLRSLDFSLVQNEAGEKRISILALRDEAVMRGELLLESSADMKVWTTEVADVEILRGEILTALLPLPNEWMQFYRVRRKN